MVTLWDWLEDRDEPADVENTYHAGTKDAKVADGRSDKKETRAPWPPGTRIKPIPPNLPKCSEN